MAKHLSASNPVSKQMDLISLDQFLTKARERGYAFIHYDAAKETEKFIILRHDLDVEPLLAVEMAERQARHGVQATYYVMLRNPLYNPFSRKYRECLHTIASLGHHIGLHFDATEYDDLDGEQILSAIVNEMALLKSLMHPVRPTRYLSFHKPNPYLLSHDVQTEDFESCYNQQFFKNIRYISDSGGNWREETIHELIERNDTSKIQFTSHPVWWVMKGATVQERLNHLIEFKMNHVRRDLAHVVNDPTRDIILFDPDCKSV